MEELTLEDIETILAALKAWKKEAGGDALLGSLLECVLVPSDKREGHETLKRASEENHRREEVCIPIEYKLIMRRNALQAKEIIREVLR